MYRVRTVFTGMQGAPWLNTLFFDDQAGTAAQAVTAVGTFWSSVDGLIDSEVDWTTLADVETVASATGQVTGVTQTTPATGSGALAAEALPIATQGLVRWRTGIFAGGREIKGRTFIPGLTETANDNGKPTSAVVTAVNAAAAALISDANSALVIYTRANSAEATVISGSCWTEFAVLRSRRD